MFIRVDDNTFVNSDNIKEIVKRHPDSIDWTIQLKEQSVCISDSFAKKFFIDQHLPAQLAVDVRTNSADRYPSTHLKFVYVNNRIIIPTSSIDYMEIRKDTDGSGNEYVAFMCSGITPNHHYTSPGSPEFIHGYIKNIVS